MFDFVSVLIYIVCVLCSVYFLSNDKVLFGLLFLFLQLIVLFANNRYVPGYRDSIVEGLKILYDSLNINKSKKIVCTIFLPNLRNKKLRIHYRYSYDEYNKPKSNRCLSLHGTGQGIAGKLFKEKNQEKMTLPNINLRQKQQIKFYNDLGFSKEEAINFRKIKSVYCWKILNGEGTLIGILSIDGKVKECLNENNLSMISEIFLSVFSNLLQRRRFSIP